MPRPVSTPLLILLLLAGALLTFQAVTGGVLQG